MWATNNELRTRLKKDKVFLWEIADKLNISEVTLIRKLRRELSQSDQELILKKAKEILSERTEKPEPVSVFQGVE
jgi:hypothetical protein